MSYREYTHNSSFHWRSPLSAERRGELIKWASSLSDEDNENLNELLRDARDAERFDAETQKSEEY